MDKKVDMKKALICDAVGFIGNHLAIGSDEMVSIDHLAYLIMDVASGCRY